MASRRDIEAGRAHVVLALKNQMERGIRAASAQLAAFGKAVKAIGAEMSGIGQGMMGMGAAAAAPIGLAVKRFADFDDAMRAVQAVSQSTDQQLAKLTDTAKRLGATTSFTAVEVASLMTELGRAGFTAEQIEAMTGAVLNLARATGTDATVASGIMAATIRQFGMAAEDATRVADALTVAANKSFNSVESLGESLSYAGPVAADFGMEVEDVLAILGGLGNVGIQGSEAGTAMRRLLTLTGAEAEKLQGIFGVAFLDAAGNARPLIDTLEDVNNATKNMASGERAKRFNEAFGLLGITAASAIGKSVGSIRELRDALGGAAGAAQEAADKMDKGLGGSFRKLWSAVEGVSIGIGAALAPAIQGLADRIILIAGNILDWVNQNRELVVTVAAWTAGVIAAGAALTGLGVALNIVGGAATLVSTVLGGVAAVVGLIASPIGLIAAGLTAIGAGFIYVTGTGSYFTTQLGTIWGALKGITQLLLAGEWSKAWDLAKLSLETLGSAVMDLFSQLPEIVGYGIGRTARAIVDGISSLVSWVQRVQGQLFKALLNNAASLAPALARAMFLGDTSGLDKLSSGALSAVYTAIGTGYGEVSKGWNKQGAPGFQASGRTKALQAQMAAMTTGKAPIAPATEGTTSAAGRTVTASSPLAAGYDDIIADMERYQAEMQRLHDEELRRRTEAQRQQLSQVELPSVSTSAEGTFSAAAAIAAMGAKVGGPDQKTAENTAAMRRGIDRLVALTRSKERLAFG